MYPVNKKVLVIDDEKNIVDVVGAYLLKEGYEAFYAYNGTQAMEIFHEINPALIILDLMLPDMTGEEICKNIRKESRVPIIIITAKIDEDSILEGFYIGADDYVTKPFSLKQLMARVNALLRRSEEEGGILSNIFSFNEDELIIDNYKREVLKNGEIINLTNTEYKLLISMAKYPKKAFTREELVCMALGEDYDGYDRVIDTHVKNLRQKVETDPKSPSYIITVHGLGYKFGGE
nr:response regulator transcription factor [Clostridium amazonitimonense]